MLAELNDVDELGQCPPEIDPRLATKPSSGTVLVEQIERLVSPEELGEGEWVDARIWACKAMGF